MEKYNLCPCGNKVKVREKDLTRGKYCSKSCLYKYRPNNGPYQKGHKLFPGSEKGWFKSKGGSVDDGGYVRLSYDSNGKRIREHRKVYEDYYGVKLTPENVIHHIDENRLNNDISNLKFFKNRAEHASEHASMRKLMKDKKTIIGMIGTGFIGKNYADNFEERGYKVVRYSLEPKYIKNKKDLVKCDYVFIAVPTPSLPKIGFDESILVKAISECTYAGQKIIIKSTIIVGTTEKLQRLFPDRYFFHSPEFLTEKTAKYDAANPDRNIIGYTKESKKYSGGVMDVLPFAKHRFIVDSKEAEITKYAGNMWFFFKIMLINTVYDICVTEDINYDKVKGMMMADSRIGSTHLDISHQGGRGAGGHCFIKDMVGFTDMYGNAIGQKRMEECEEDGDLFPGFRMLSALQIYNIYLLLSTGKDLELLEGVYGKEFLKEAKSYYKELYGKDITKHIKSKKTATKGKSGQKSTIKKANNKKEKPSEEL